jgi:hypothetical protein
MMSLVRVLAVLTVLSLASTAQAVDRGQFGDVPEDVRAWFKGLRNSFGVPCCDVADGHRTSYEVRDGAYWVPIDGAWWPVARTGRDPQCRQSCRRSPPPNNLLMASPSPVPVCGCDTPSAPRSNGAKIRYRSPGWMPGPVSRISNSATGLR